MKKGKEKKIPNGNYQLAKVSIGHLKNIYIDIYLCLSNLNVNEVYGTILVAYHKDVIMSKVKGLFSVVPPELALRYRLLILISGSYVCRCSSMYITKFLLIY